MPFSIFQMQIFDFLMQEGNSNSPIMGLVAQQVATRLRLQFPLVLSELALSVVSKVTCQFSSSPFWWCDYVTASTWVTGGRHASCSAGGCLTDHWLTNPWWDCQNLIDRSNHTVWQLLCDTIPPPNVILSSLLSNPFVTLSHVYFTSC